MKYKHHLRVWGIFVVILIYYIQSNSAKGQVVIYKADLHEINGKKVQINLEVEKTIPKKELVVSADSLNEELTIENSLDHYYKLINSEGSIVRQGEFTNKIDVSGLKRGQYWVKIGGDMAFLVKE